MKRLLTAILVLSIVFSSFGQVSNTFSVKFSTAIINRWPSGINSMTSKGWEYSNTIVLHGMEKVYNNVTDSARYLNYIKTYIDGYMNGSGVLNGTVTLVSLDRIHPGISCLFLYEKTGLLKYKTAATTLRNLLVGGSATYTRTPSNKIYWHKLSGYDNVMMLDGIYMAHPFLAKYGSLFGDNAAIDTAVDQALFAYNQLYVSANKLVKHAWKEPGTPGAPATWTPDAFGNSPSIWSRAMGWYVMALVDILKYVPAAHPKRGQLITALNNIATGIKNFQDPVSGLWYQVVNKTSATLSGNYLESSGSAMFVYALKTACDNNWIAPATFLSVAQSGWAGLKANAIDTWPTDGGPRINNFAPAMSALNSDALYAGTASVDCPGSAHPHGYAAIMMAASVMEFPLLTLPVKFISFTAKEYAGKTQLAWENGDETDVDRYEVEKSFSGTDFNTIGSVKSTGIYRYTWEDNIENTTVYYRIKAVSIDGSIHYSAILPVRRQSAGFSMQVTPNPVRDGIVNIFLSNVSTGKYNIKIVNNLGNIVTMSTITINDNGTTVRSLSLPAGAAKGLYYVQMEGNGLRINKNILVK